MKKLLVFMIFVLCLAGTKARNLSAFFSYCTFDVPGKSPYLETYLNVIGTTVNFIATENNTLVGQIEVQWIIRSGNTIVYADKYTLISPSIQTTDSLIPDFLDQKRLDLKMGDYDIELTIKDKNTDSKETTLNQKIIIGFPLDKISISDIEFIESYTQTSNTGKFTKSGYDVIPFVNAFYPKEISKLNFYAEIYRSNISSTDDYLVRYYLSNKESNLQIDNYVVNKKQSAKNINAIIGEFSISDIPSGNYYLNIEVRNKKNELIAFNHAFFQRSNERNKPKINDDFSSINISNTFISPIINKDTLIDFIACLYPISSQVENEIAEHQLINSDVRSMQQFIYYFWTKRYPVDPEKAWKDYKLEVLKVNNSFSSLIKKGYETDRGRVYLQYGPPNVRKEVIDEPGTFPHEIWQYYKLKSQTNRKFVFVTSDRASNDFRLAHSDAIGEIFDQDWEVFLKGNNSIDKFGSQTKDIYSNPH